MIDAAIPGALRLRATIRISGALTGQISLPMGVAEYAGAYEVRPRIDAQTLPTAGKRMARDVLVEEIPVSEVDNDHGGRTITIGGI